MKKLLKPKEVAELIGVQLSTIYKWTHIDFIPHVKAGGALRFLESDILEWLDKRKSKGRKTRKIDIDKLLR